MLPYEIESIFIDKDGAIWYKKFSIKPERIAPGNTTLSFSERGTSALLLEEKKYDNLDAARLENPKAALVKSEWANPENACDICGHSVDCHDHGREDFGGCLAPCLVPGCSCREFYWDWEEWTDLDASEI